MRYSFILVILSALIFACSESTVDTDTDRLGWQYFPTTLGAYSIYQVEETKYALVGSEVLSYQLRESIVDSVKSGDEIQYIVNRETRLDETESWQLDSVWTARINPNRAILVENNVSFVKLTFPIENNLSWDGNSFNARVTDPYRYENQLKDTILFEQSYSDLWTVIQSDFGEDFLGRNDRYEVYAPNAGLIIKSVVIWNYCQTDCSSEKQIVGGRELNQTLVEYGMLENE